MAAELVSSCFEGSGLAIMLMLPMTSPDLLHEDFKANSLQVSNKAVLLEHICRITT